MADKQIKTKKVLFDNWYSAWDNLKLVNSLGFIFYTTLKSNRLVSLSKEEGYIHLDDIEWTDQRLRSGVMIKLKKVPFKVKLFKLVAKNGDVLRWQVEEFKQLTGSEKCQCRKARSQRNHIGCCYHVWLSLKVQAKNVKTTIYQARAKLFSDYLKAELRSPRIQAYFG